ncbi:MAG: DUF1569 domain-containing protein [Flammeovirgaceae bacterium]
MDRRKFIKRVGISTAVIATAGTGFGLVFDHKTTHQPLAVRTVRFTSMAEARKELEIIEKAKGLEVSGDWDLYQNLIHCAQSIEYSLTGYPKDRNPLFQLTIGALALSKFDRQGFMAHNLNEPIPKAPVIQPKGQLDQAFFRLRKAIDDFDRHQGSFKPHFAYGKLTKKAYAKAHAMHLADHFSGMNYG